MRHCFALLHLKICYCSWPPNFAAVFKVRLSGPLWLVGPIVNLVAMQSRTWDIRSSRFRARVLDILGSPDEGTLPQTMSLSRFKLCLRFCEFLLFFCLGWEAKRDNNQEQNTETRIPRIISGFWVYVWTFRIFFAKLLRCRLLSCDLLTLEPRGHVRRCCLALPLGGKLVRSFSPQERCMAKLLTGL